MPSAIHEIAVAAILQDHPEAKTHGMLKALRVAVGPLRENDFRGYGVIPDAFVVDHEKKLLVAFEVEGAYPLNDRKMEIYCDLWWTLDGIGWDFLLVTVDRWGNRTSVDMGDFAIAKVVHDAKRSGRKPPPSYVAWVAEYRRMQAEPPPLPPAAPSPTHRGVR